MATKTLTVSENVSYICFPPLNAKTVKGKLAFDCPVVYLYFGFTPTFDIEPKMSCPGIPNNSMCFYGKHN